MINKVILCGRVSKVNNRKSFNGKNIIYLTLETNSKWVNKDGVPMEKVEQHQCQCYDKVADFVMSNDLLNSIVFIEGSLSTENWSDEFGVQKSATRVQVILLKKLEEFDFVVKSCDHKPDNYFNSYKIHTTSLKL